MDHRGCFETNSVIDPDKSDKKGVAKLVFLQHLFNFLKPCAHGADPASVALQLYAAASLLRDVPLREFCVSYIVLPNCPEFCNSPFSPASSTDLYWEQNEINNAVSSSKGKFYLFYR